jgi:hypothetical protein
VIDEIRKLMLGLAKEVVNKEKLVKGNLHEQLG